ncbi:MAG: tRNA (adenosine(37)-N6)-threonylcarbamoyltransferase complex ATPase subunit type 1 TsaE [Clostridiales bacterium]
MIHCKSNTEKDTLLFGEKLGKILYENSLICLDGDLGTGKTVITRGIARGLGIEEYITSPTFTLINEYESKLNLYHFDVYRIHTIDELYEIGFEEYIYNGICVIEWSENINKALPNEFIKIKIEKDNIDYNLRNIYIDFKGEKYSELKRIFQESGKYKDETVSY